jgi:hypothetical protein
LYHSALNLTLKLRKKSSYVMILNHITGSWKPESG